MHQSINQLEGDFSWFKLDYCLIIWKFVDESKSYVFSFPFLYCDLSGLLITPSLRKIHSIYISGYSYSGIIIPMTVEDISNGMWTMSGYKADEKGILSLVPYKHFLT